jgi:FkbH-like protein
MRPTVKCVVWDLDNTLWDGVLLESARVTPRPSAVEAIRTLDDRGILHSIASKNDREHAMETLRGFGLEQYFLHPQIHWGSKAASIAQIAAALNIGLDALAFLDDDPVEREEVRFSHPSVLCLDSAAADALPQMVELQPRFITDESRRRRAMYAADIARASSEAAFIGPKSEFLASLGMTFTIREALEGDLQRAEELTVRTHQLNTTGYTYSYEQLDEFRRSPRHTLLVASLEDRFGTYGTIGLALVDCDDRTWTIKLLLMSCRVMPRGVGQILLSHVMHLARAAGVELQAEFVPNGRNRMMLVTYRFAGFRELEVRDGSVILSSRPDHEAPFPSWIDVRIGR